MDTRPRTIITSRQAQDHIETARTTMEEMKFGMQEQKMKNEALSMQMKNSQMEQDRFNSTQNHELAMQKQKLDSLMIQKSAPNSPKTV